MGALGVTFGTLVDISYHKTVTHLGQLQLGSCRHIQGGENNMQFHFYFSVFHTLDSVHLIIKIDIEYFSQSYRK